MFSPFFLSLSFVLIPSRMKVSLENNCTLEDCRLSQSSSKLALLFSPNFIVFCLVRKRSELQLPNCEKPDSKSVNYLPSPLSHTLHLANRDRLSGVHEGRHDKAATTITAVTRYKIYTKPDLLFFFFSFWSWRRTQSDPTPTRILFMCLRIPKWRNWCDE